MGLAFVLATVGASNAHAATVNYGGTDYEVQTVSGTFSDLKDYLMADIWWGNASIAAHFAVANQGLFGISNGGGLHELYAYSARSGPTPGSIESTSHARYQYLGTWYSSTQYHDENAVKTYATTQTISSVPLPAGGLLLLSGLFGVAAIRRRKKRLS